MDEGKKTTRIPHHFILEDRKQLTLSGVSDIDRFDEDIVVVYTVMGELTIKGSDLHINALNVETGELIVTGEMDSFVYQEATKDKGSFFSKIFK